MRRCAFFLIGLGFAFLTLGVTSWADDSETKAKAETKPREALKIGVIDLAKVFSEYQKRGDGRVKLMKEKKEKELELKKKGAEIKKLEQQLEVLSGEKKLKKQAEYKEKRKSFEAYFEVHNDELADRQCKLWKTIYNEIINEVKRSAEQEGYDIVLKVDDTPINGDTVDKVEWSVALKEILFHSPRVDLTDGIINVLNEKYKRAKESKERGS